MLCRATMSSYKVSMNQILWSEPTHPHTWRKQDWSCSLVFSDNWQNSWNLPSKKKRYFCSLTLLLLGSGPDLPSAFLHANRLRSPLTLQRGLLLLRFQLFRGVEPGGYFTCCIVLSFSSFSSAVVRYSLQQGQLSSLAAVQAYRDVH